MNTWGLRRRHLVVLTLLSSIFPGRVVDCYGATSDIPPQVSGWTEFSENIGPDTSLSIEGNTLIFSNIGRFKLVFFRHYDSTDGGPSGDLYKIKESIINSNISQNYVPNETLGCSNALGVGYVLLTETKDQDLNKALLHFSSVPGKDAPKLDGNDPYTCLTSTWIEVGNKMKAQVR